MRSRVTLARIDAAAMDRTVASPLITRTVVPRATVILARAKERLGERVFAPGVTIVDDPLRLRGLRSRPFDGEGVRVSLQELVSNGMLNQWIAESASARQLGIEPTGHAGRGVGGAPGATPSNLYLEAGVRSRDELLASVPEAILVVELIGQGVNPVTGDYSRGAAGFWVEGGEIRFPVEEVTIAGNLLDIFKGIVSIGRDVLVRGSKHTGSILVDRMTIAGD